MESKSHPYPALARLTVAGYFDGVLPDQSVLDSLSPDKNLWSPRRGCFVSIKTLDGDLRGCIGTIMAARDNLGLEIMANAVSAAVRDPRFKPMTAGELAGVVFSVDVLGVPEAVDSLDQLDPVRWGVIVSKGGRRGLLLPDLEGVDTVEKQLGIAARKAGLTAFSDLTVERFSVERFAEQGRG
ncbi:AmmeMemoRadiSam system protein A [Deltaproteobacteria bacterium OttesenSCG-928-K17]|nr:AmmeMemoRadiSam system protein A [Deltaproteobacteria bacterium OttesenSCG-928-K17]